RQSPAAGVLRHGDKIVAVDGHKGGPESFVGLISAHRCAGGAQKQGCPAATPASITVVRGGRTLTFKVRPRYDSAAGRPLVGFQYADRRVSYSASKAVGQAFSRFWFITRETVKLPSYIFNAHKRKQISGIVGTSNAAHQAVSAD